MKKKIIYIKHWLEMSIISNYLKRVNVWCKLIIILLEATLGVLSVIPLSKLRPI